MPEKTFRKQLFGCFLLALLLRVALALPGLSAPETLCRPDTPGYLDPAQAMVRGEWPGISDAMLVRPPGYPLFLALVIAWCGHSLLPMALAGCLLSASAVWPVALATRRAAGERAALIGALFWSFSVTSIAAAPQILSDTMLAVLAAWQCFQAVCALRSGQWRDFAILCLFAVVMCYVKPVNLPVVLFGLPVLALATARSARSFGIRLLTAALLFATLLLPWWLFMARRTGGFDGNTPNSVFHNGSAVMARATGESSELWRRKLLAEAEEAFAREPERYASLRARNQWKIARFKRMIREYPKVFAVTHLPHPANLLPDLPGLLENNRITVPGGGTMAVLRQKGLRAALDHYLAGRRFLLWAALPLLAVTGIVYLGAACSLAFWLRGRQWRLLLAFGVLVFYYIWAPGPVISPRYALPALPFLIVMIFWRKNEPDDRPRLQAAPAGKEEAK